MPLPQPFIHPTAVVDEGACIAASARVWHFCHLYNGCSIGEGCSIGQNCVIFPGVVLGRNVKVQNNVSLYEGVVCEDDVFVGPSVVFTNVRNPRSAISRKGRYMPTLVRRGATIGANATVVCGVEIGAHAFIGAGAVVTRDVPSYALILGNPARQAGWMSEWGHRLHFDERNEAICPESGERYRLERHQVIRIPDSNS